MGRVPCCDKANVKKGPWSPEEDAKLKDYIEKHGTGGNWIALPQKIGLRRCGKSCRLRWLNYLRPNIKHGGFSEEEDNLICSLYISIGSRWSIIAAQLPGRTDNDVKNYWNTKLKKKLLGRRKQTSLRHRSLSMKDVNGCDDISRQSQALSNSALERLQLHMQLQSPFSFYNNPTLWPKMHPLTQQKMVQTPQILNESSSSLIRGTHPNISPLENDIEAEKHKSSPVDSLTAPIDSIKTTELNVYEFANSMNKCFSSSDASVSFRDDIGSNSMDQSYVRNCLALDSTLQADHISNDILEYNKLDASMSQENHDQVGTEYDCFKEMDNSTKEDLQVWWPDDYNVQSALSWNSTSVLQSEDGSGYYELDYRHSIA